MVDLSNLVLKTEREERAEKIWQLVYSYPQARFRYQNKPAMPRQVAMYFESL